MYDELHSSSIVQSLPSLDCIAPTCSRRGGATDDVPIMVKLDFKDLTKIDVPNSIFEVDLSIHLSWLVARPVKEVEDLLNREKDGSLDKAERPLPEINTEKAITPPLLRNMCSK